MKPFFYNSEEGRRKGIFDKIDPPYYEFEETSHEDKTNDACSSI
jgi:hypothetical protein